MNILISTRSGKPLISIIIPCYQQAQYLSEAVDSIHSQTYDNWECIIVNDGSPDDTREIGQALASSDDRIRYVEQPNKGTSAAKNRGLEEIQGEYVQFLDADDLLLPRKFELQLASLSDKTGPKVSYTEYRCISDNSSITVPPNFSRTPMLSGNPLLDIAAGWSDWICIPIHSFLFDAMIFRDQGVRFDTELDSWEDYFCWLHVFKLHPLVTRVNEQLVIYRWHAGSATQSTTLWKDNGRAVRKAHRLFRWDPLIRSGIEYRLHVIEEYEYSKLHGWRHALGFIHRLRRLNLTTIRRKWLILTGYRLQI